MTLDDALPLVFSFAAVVAALALLARRLRLNGLHNNTRRRYVFIDILIVVAALEIALDAVAEATSPAVEPLQFAVLIGRGAVAAGVIALLLSFPAHLRETANRPRRRAED